MFILFGDHLNAKLPFGESSIFYGFPKIAAVEIRILARNLSGFIPRYRVYTQQRFPMEFYKNRFSFFVDQAESMDAKTLHHPQTAGNGTIAHGPHNHVHGFRHQRYKIPESIMSRSCLRNLVMRFGLHSMDQVGKFNGILNKKYWNIVSHQIIIPFFSIKFNRETADIPGQIS